MTISKNTNNNGAKPTDAVAGNPMTPKGATKGNTADEPIKVLRVYVSEISDWRRVCTADEAEKYANPLTSMLPALVNTISTPQLVAFAKTLELHGLDFCKLSIQQNGAVMGTAI